MAERPLQAALIVEPWYSRNHSPKFRLYPRRHEGAARGNLQTCQRTFRLWTTKRSD